ncbi:E3 ubiquitin-protein ligase PRT1-like isoform X2 [Tasmannia lanceolata]|uniref:E3 ubiquitin-protein ligase PRT1-like isoform X2 n=1 Tax=Tasmannia lanceolata TaxID=3420 RepID=UPI0040631F47
MDGKEEPFNSPRSTMEDQTLDSCDGNADEEFPESFRCCVCLDLLYKPVVLACGHISCFWCVHISMSCSRESHCPMCRHPFLHFPSICQLLHFLLLKMFTVAYKRREREVIEEEKKHGNFSPQFGDLLTTERLHTEKSKDRTVVEPVDCDTSPDIVTMVHEGSYVEKSEDNGNAVSEGNTIPENVYCKPCITTSVDEILKCQECQSLHPGGLPKVCLELNDFLEKQFPNEYELRREALQLKQVHNRQESLTECSGQDGKQGAKSLQWPISYDFSSWDRHAGKINFGVGCDGCGMFPIIGKRYKCKDCVEKIGFDLCEGCYNTQSKLPGRFNQKHIPDHTFVLVQRDRPVPPVDMPRHSLRIVSTHNDSSVYSLVPEDPVNTDSTI